MPVPPLILHDRGRFSDLGRVSAAFSGGRRNALQVVGEELSEGFARGVVAEALAGAVVELAGDGLEPGGGVVAEVGALGGALARPAGGVVVSAPPAGRWGRG